MPKATASHSYHALISAILNNRLTAVKKLLKRENVAQFINNDPRGYDNPAPLLQALTPANGKVNADIVKALLSVTTIQVNIKRPRTDKTLTEILTAVHLEPDVEADILTLMIKRGLKIAAPQNKTENATPTQTGHPEVNTYARMVKRGLEIAAPTKTPAEKPVETIVADNAEINTHAQLIDVIDEDFLLVPVLSLTTPLTTTAVIPPPTGLWAWFGYSNPPAVLSIPQKFG